MKKKNFKKPQKESEKIKNKETKFLRKYDK